jgi:release factor glutamine methyltransferase
MSDNQTSLRRALLEEGEGILKRVGIDSARLDAEVLLAHACGIARSVLVAGNPRISSEVAEKFHASIRRRSQREPLAYIIGKKEFFSIDFEVTPAVLIPRPETETLVEVALKFLATRPESRVLDIGTGSGAIAIAIAVNSPDGRVVATDISNDAIEIAHRNAIRSRCDDRIEFLAADLLPHANSRYDLIVSNPPYVRASEVETLQPEIRVYEPRLALTAGDDGLTFYRRIATESPAWLKAHGAVMVEIGATQRAAVEGLFRNAGFSQIHSVADLAGIERVICASMR